MASLAAMIVGALYTYGRAVLGGGAVLAMMLWKQLTSPTKFIFAVKKRDTPPKCLTDKDQGQHGYLTVNGLKIHYVEKGDRSKPLMLFVHGFPEFWYSWRHQMKEFSKDYWTVAIDMRGYGDSEKPPSVSDYKLHLLVDDIREIVIQLGRKTFILVAHDWGAVISWAFVDKYPEMIDKYIMMNGPHSKVFAAMMKTPEQSAKSWYVFFFQLPYLPELFLQMYDLGMFSRVFFTPKKSNPYITEDDIEAFKYTFGKPGACTPPINYYRALIRQRICEGFKPAVGPKQNERGRPPGLYIFGAQDVALDIRNVEKHKEYFESLETVIIAEGNHFVQQDEPIAVNNAMRLFLKTKAVKDSDSFS